MKLSFLIVGSGCLSLLVTGCAGVPQLYRPDPTKPNEALAPKVDDIVHQIACELRSASEAHLEGRNYVINTFLTLQVDDTLHLTPSLSFINPLKTSGTNFTVSEGLDLGGERRRSYTSTMFLESKELLKSSRGESATSTTCNNKKLYSLSGDLGLKEIVRDGVAAYLVRYGDRLVHPDIELGKTAFGSTVQFAVNRTVSALGPVWTLTTFKGPGGAAGLVNGKRVGTDTLIVTFALQSNDPKAVEDALARVRDRQEVAMLTAKRFEAVAAANVVAQRRRIEAKRKLALWVGRTQKSLAERAAANEDIARADQAQQQADQAQAELSRARGQLEEARSQAQEVSRTNEIPRSDAAGAAQGLLQNMILQNLNVQPR